MGPLACEASSLPKYPPSKEIDANLREEARRYIYIYINFGCVFTAVSIYINVIYDLPTGICRRREARAQKDKQTSQREVPGDCRLNKGIIYEQVKVIGTACMQLKSLEFFKFGRYEI